LGVAVVPDYEAGSELGLMTSGPHFVIVVAVEREWMEVNLVDVTVRRCEFAGEWRALEYGEAKWEGMKKVSIFSLTFFLSYPSVCLRRQVSEKVMID